MISNGKSLAEQGLRLNLQLFAEGEPEPTPTEPANIEPGQAEPQPEPTEPVGEPEPSFTGINPQALTPELQTLYKSMQSDFTKKTQEIAPLRKVMEQSGATVEEVNQAIQMLQYARTNPQEFYREFGQYLGQATPQPQTPPVIDEENPYAGDQYFEAAVAKAVEKRVGSLEQNMQQLSKVEQERRTKAFQDDATKAIKDILARYPDTGVSESQLLASAIKGKVPPNQIHNALIDAMGGFEKYEEYIKRHTAADYSKQVQEKNKSVTVPMAPGAPGIQSVATPKLGSRDSIQSTLEMAEANRRARLGR